jgi:hypothetical protein
VAGTTLNSCTQFGHCMHRGTRTKRTETQSRSKRDLSPIWLKANSLLYINLNMFKSPIHKTRTLSTTRVTFLIMSLINQYCLRLPYPEKGVHKIFWFKITNIYDMNFIYIIFRIQDFKQLLSSGLFQSNSGRQNMYLFLWLLFLKELLIK